jgi:hypothetical protein
MKTVHMVTVIEQNDTLDLYFSVLHQQANGQLQIQHKQKTNKYNQSNNKKLIIKIK